MTTQSSRPNCFVFQSKESEVKKAQEMIEGALEAAGADDRSIFAIRLAMEEALVNAVKHGNQGDATKIVNLEYEIQENEFRARVEDQGEGFDPADVPDPTAVENLERPCGRGLMLMRHYMDVSYNQKGNAVELRRTFMRIVRQLEEIGQKISHVLQQPEQDAG